MTFGTEWGWGADEVESRAMFDAFSEAGGNFIDTADAYTGGTSEKMLGRFVAPERDRYVISTKYTMTKKPHLTRSGNSRKHMMRSVDESLQRLGTDYIDLYYVHFWDFTTSIEEVMRAFDDLVSAGKVLHVGMSNTPAWIVSRAQTMSELCAWMPLAAVQIEYSLADRTAERDVVPMAAALDLAVTTWSPLAGGILTGKYRRQHDQGRRLDGQAVEIKHDSLINTLEDVALAHGCSPAQIAIAWLLARNNVAQVIPIIGATTQVQLSENVAALDIVLDSDARERLDVASAVDLGTPHEVLRDPRSRWHATGGHHEMLDLRTPTPW